MTGPCFVSPACAGMFINVYRCPIDIPANGFTLFH